MDGTDPEKSCLEKVMQLGERETRSKKRKRKETGQVTSGALA